MIDEWICLIIESKGLKSTQHGAISTISILILNCDNLSISLIYEWHLRRCD